MRILPDVASSHRGHPCGPTRCEPSGLSCTTGPRCGVVTVRRLQRSIPLFDEQSPFASILSRLYTRCRVCAWSRRFAID